jgi:hypothetical protein
MTRVKRTNKRHNRKVNKRSRTFRKSGVLPTRVELMRGGNNGSLGFPALNDFSRDPNYSMIAARNTGPLLTGTYSGGRRRNTHMRRSTRLVGKRRNRRAFYGGNDVGMSISNGLNTVTNSIGIIPAPAINETSGIAGLMSGFSGSGAAFNSMPSRITPLS